MSALTLNIPGLLRAAPSSGPSAREEGAASGQSGDDFSALFDQCGWEPPLAAAGEGDGVAKEGAAKQETAKPDAVTADKDATAFGFGASLSGGEGDLVANLLCLAAPAGTPGGTAPAASNPSASKGDDAARLPDWSGLNMPVGDGSGAQRLPGGAAETSAAARERRIVADTGAPRSEANRVTSALSFPIIKEIESARVAAAAPAVDGPRSGRDDEAKTTRPETAAKDEPQSAPQAVAPAVPTPLDAGTQGVSAASFAVAATAVPMAVAPETRGDSAARNQSSRAVPAPGAAATTQAPLARPRARDNADPALSLSTAREDATTRVSVTSQRTWLEPVRPDFVPAPQGAEARSGAEARAPTEAAQTVSQPVEALAPANAAELMPQSRAENNFSAPASGEARPVDKAPAAADPAPAPRAATLRRDLDVTLEPRDLGGLALRLKSVGDRLEIAFVADKGDTAQMIGDGSATLASQLRVAGLGLGGVAISVETKPDVAANLGADHARHGASAGGDPGGGQGSSGQDMAPRRQHNFGGGGQEHRDESTGDGDNARARRGDRGFYL
jgi:flagellar hook-length control protein FliK